MQIARNLCRLVNSFCQAQITSCSNLHFVCPSVYLGKRELQMHHCLLLLSSHRNFPFSLLLFRCLNVLFSSLFLFFFHFHFVLFSLTSPSLIPFYLDLSLSLLNISIITTIIRILIMVILDPITVSLSFSSG